MTVKLNKKQQAALTRLFSLFKPGHYIYPGVLIRELNIEMKVAYEILDLLKTNNFLIELYEIYCPNESKSTGIIYDNLLDLIGDDIIQDCPECSHPVNIRENNILIYKMTNKVKIEYEQ